MPKRFVVVTKGSSGVIELHPMKQWLRTNPEQLPADFTVEHRTSHQLRDALKKYGWTVNEIEDEVRLLRPDIADDEDSISVLGESEPDSDLSANGSEEQFEFALESHLRDFIVRNLATIPIAHKHLRLYVDENGRNGVESPTAVGPIDILAVDGVGNFVVFELKLARGPDRAMGQLLRYMGWVKKNLAGDREVHGVVVAKEIDPKLRYAALPVPNVSVLEYELDFKLRAAGLDDDQEAVGRVAHTSI